MFHDVPQSTIQLVQANAKSPSEIKRILDKPNISDSTALAYGRLSNQYVKLMEYPTKPTINYVQKKYKAFLIYGEFDFNLGAMGNSETYDYEVEDDYEEPPEIEEVHHAKPPSVEELLRIITGQTPIVKRWGYLVKIPIHDWDKEQPQIERMLRDFTVYAPDFRYNGFTQMRIFLKLETDGKTIWVSTGKFPIRDGFSTTSFLTEYHRKIEAHHEYWVQDEDEFVQLKGVKEVQFGIYM